MPRFKDTAVCIRHLDFSESSQVVVLLTEQHGKVRGIAKGSRRLAPSSIQRFSGGIELLTVGQVVATTRRNTDLAGITEWNLLDDTHGLRGDLRAQRVAMYAGDVVHALLADVDPHPATYSALVTLLQELGGGGGNTGGEDADEKNEAALLRFQWALLVDVGYRPELDRDVRSDAALGRASSYTFDPHAGGFTADHGINAWRVRRATLEALRRVADGTSVEDPETCRRANRLLCSYLRALLDRELPTMSAVLA